VRNIGKRKKERKVWSEKRGQGVERNKKGGPNPIDGEKRKKGRVPSLFAKPE